MASGAEIQLPALDWWWARRDRFGLGPQLSLVVLLRLTKSHNLYLLQWYLDRCTPDSPLPALKFDDVALMVSSGRVDMVEQIWQLSVTDADQARYERDRGVVALKRGSQLFHVARERGHQRAQVRVGSQEQLLQGHVQSIGEKE
ncbi:hypothetical protein BC828DRAFT_406644 [Blastocladiella britannica]|nr:hypothetical protein BC828DRAFT_406644 [Blastocladiella britannica]